MSNGHAPFPPSAAKRWMACTASFGLGLQVPEPASSEYADEGTRLHEVAADALLHGTAVPTDDALALKPYLDYAKKRIKAADWHAVEERITYSRLLFGTADLLLIEGDLLEVVDLKTGHGILVDPEENEQLLTYAFMALAKLDDARIGRNITRVRLTIVQPPDEAKPVKTWDTTLARVLEHGAAVEAAIQAAIGGRGELVPGEHCRFCKARAVCPALRGEMVEALGGALPATMNLKSLASWLDRADRLEQFIKALREVGHRVAEEAVQAGAPGIPGWCLKPKRATRQWADEDAVLEIARRRKIKIFQDKLLSPAMAEKAHPNLPEELREQIVAVSSGSNLVRGESTHVVNAPPPTSLEAAVNLLKLRSM